MRLAQKTAATGAARDYSLGYKWDLDPGSRVLVVGPESSGDGPGSSDCLGLYYGGRPPHTGSESNDGGLSPLMMVVGWTAAIVAVVGMFVHVTGWKPGK